MRTIHKDGINWIDRASDERFRHLLIHGAPRSVSLKLKDALSRHPKANAREYSEAHFGAELPVICAAVAPLVDLLCDYYESIGAPRFREWLSLTGYGDDYRFISAMVEWAAMKREPAAQTLKATG